MGTKRVTEDYWNKFWIDTKITLEEDKKIIKDQFNSIRWKKIEQRLIDKFGTFSGLNIIEIGSGRGEISLSMAQRGARVKLLDKSKFALAKAKQLFKNFNLEAEFTEGDIFSLSNSLYQQFDVSMSFGLAEHFKYPKRREVFDIHYKLLKPGGISIISVPNIFCPAYWLFRWIAKTTKHWKVGFEVPFSLRELLSCGERSGFKNMEIKGSSFLYDTVHFLLLQPLFHILGKEVACGMRYEIPTYMDELLGGYLTLIAERG